MVVDSAWRAEDEIELAGLLDYEYNHEQFDPFIRRISPRLPPPPHLAPLIDVWERTRTEAVRAVIELPPRHAKTTTALHGFAWRMMLDPSLHHAFITYAESLSLTKSRAARRFAKSAGADITTTNVRHWELAEGGSFLATGVGGGITGKGITGVAVIDDPHKNRKEAESRLIRDGIWNWFTDTFWTRLEDDASVLIIQTRWHKDDLAGRVLKGFEDPETGEPIDFERIRLPALAEHEDPLGRSFGQALWPERFSRKKLLGIKAIMGPYGFSSLYQQDPKSKGKQIFSDFPARFSADDFKLDGHRVVIACDPAASEKESSDHSAVVVCAAKGYGENMEMWVLDHLRMQIEIPALVRYLKRFQTEWWGVAVAVEDAGVGKAVPQLLRAEDKTLRVTGITPLGDKWMRAQPVASAWSGTPDNEGDPPKPSRVHIPIDRPWAKVLMAECTDFTPAATEDDQVDALAHAWNTLYIASKPKPRGSRRNRHSPFG